MYGLCKVKTTTPKIAFFSVQGFPAILGTVETFGNHGAKTTNPGRQRRQQKRRGNPESRWVTHK